MTTFIRYSPLLNDQLAAKELSLTGYGVYSILRYEYGLGKVDIDAAHIASKVKLSEATVRNKLRELTRLGWVVAERKNSRYGKNQYWLCLEPFEKESEVAGTVDDLDDDGVLRFVGSEDD